MECQLSVLCPGIRTENWKKLVDSVEKSFSGSWEIIFISPYELPQELVGKSRIRWINDWGTPIRCQQLGLIQSLGEYITWAADDGVYTPGSLDIAFKKLEGKNYKTLVMGKYIEGQDNTHMPMTENKYYNLKNHDASKLLGLARDCYWMLNVGVVPKRLLIDVGGWDCGFEVCPMSYNDLAIRLQNYNVEFIIQDELMYQCSHMPGTMGDHGPVHFAQILHDQPLFNKIYSHPSSAMRIRIDINTWSILPDRWERRFGKIA